MKSNTDKLQELVESGALDMPKAKQDTTKVKEARILGDLRIFQAIHNDLKLKHEIVTTEDGRKVYAYTYDGIDPYELEDEAFPTFLTLIDKCTREARIDELEREWVDPEGSDYVMKRIAQLTEQKDGE